MAVVDLFNAYFNTNGSFLGIMEGNSRTLNNSNGWVVFRSRVFTFCDDIHPHLVASQYCRSCDCIFNRKESFKVKEANTHCMVSYVSRHCLFLKLRRMIESCGD